ncbi:MAG: hypothetical protein A2Y34_12285 [Spirochaetes bacterium GWC1_27_15]|nr:MAG: hypothetical protein A2Z98_11435 [Spirochaetes bacterium GWB1_27_13]OHD25110.1 MAG: hypothetical protein A2Y34_12285 [Spirochaetes bacterium GWC1_27_15]
MAKSKRSNYLIDKPFQLGFIAKFLLVILATVVVTFAVIALYYYQDSLLGTNRLDQNISIKTRGQKSTSEGYKIYKYDKESIDVYEKTENGKKIYICENPYTSVNFKTGDVIENIMEGQLEPAYGPLSQETKMFYIIIFPLLWLSLAILAIISFYSLFFSHRMAGPIYRLRVSLDRMIAGDFDFKIRVRKNDFFINIVEKLEHLRLKIKNNDLVAPMPKDKLLELKNLVQSKASTEDIVKKIDDLIS